MDRVSSAYVSTPLRGIFVAAFGAVAAIVFVAAAAAEQGQVSTAKGVARAPIEKARTTRSLSPYLCTPSGFGQIARCALRASYRPDRADRRFVSQ